MHALSESIERGGVLHQQLRGLKESLVASALRLYVTNRIAEEDETLMDHLKQDALESKAQSLEAEKKANLAIEIVQDLTAEVKKLKSAVGESIYCNPITSSTMLGIEAARTMTAEEEIDAMISVDDDWGHGYRAALSSSSYDPCHHRRINSGNKVRPSSSPGQPVSNGSRGFGGLHKSEDEITIWDDVVGLKKELIRPDYHQQRQHGQVDRQFSQCTAFSAADHIRYVLTTFTTSGDVVTHVTTPFHRWMIQ